MPEVHVFGKIETEEQLRDFVFQAFGVRIPDVQVCEDHTTPWRAFADAYFARSPNAVWKASRGFGGKSFLLALLALTEALTLKCNVNVLGGSGEQSDRVLEYTSDFWHAGTVSHYLVGEVKHETRLIFGNHIRSLMASSRSVRGPHPQRLRLDECDEMDESILNAALGQTMRKPGLDVRPQNVMSSTHHYADETFTKILHRANQEGWPIYEWCYRENLQPHGWLDPLDVEEKKATVTSAMWLAEYELQDPAPGSRAINVDMVAKMFDRSLGEYRGSPGEYIEIEPPWITCRECGWVGFQNGDRCSKCGSTKIRVSGRYGTGADWARKQDWTVIITWRWDVKPFRLVAFERIGRLPWPKMIERLNVRHKRYPGGAAHDATGVGDVVRDYLSTSVKDVIMVGARRSDMLTEYIAAIERGDFVCPHIDFMEAEHRLASVDDVFRSGTSFHLPDSISAGALGLYGKTGILIG